jgi:TolB protein
VPSFDDRLREGFARLARPADSSTTFERVASKKAGHRVVQRIKIAALAVVVLAGTSLATYWLLDVFEVTQSVRPTAPLAYNGKIAFVRYSSTGPTSQIVVLDPADGTLSVIWEAVGDTGVGDTGGLAWSPDGTRLVFDHWEPDLGKTNWIYSVQADGSDLKTLSNAGAAPAWSPDGHSIAFVANNEGRPEIRLMGPDGNNIRVIRQFRPHAGPTVLNWSPDSHRLVYSRSVNGNSDIYVLSIDRGTEERLTDDPGADLVPAWSPDGARIAFGHQLGPAPTHAQVFLMNADGSAVIQLTNEESGYADPVWAPDGTKILFLRPLPDGSGSDLWVMDADGSNQHLLFKGPLVSPAWQPVPTDGSPPSPLPSPSESIQDACSINESKAFGDFDGNGTQDQAIVGRTACLLDTASGEADPEFSILVMWGPDQEALWPLPQCEGVCGVWTADLDDDGEDELAILASYTGKSLVEFYGLAADQNGPMVFVTDNGEHPVPVQLRYDESVMPHDFITCDTAPDGTHLVIATSTRLSEDRGQWHVQEMTWAFDGTVEPFTPPGFSIPWIAAFAPVSTDSYETPNTGGPLELPIPGTPCISQTRGG